MRFEVSTVEDDSEVKRVRIAVQSNPRELADSAVPGRFFLHSSKRVPVRCETSTKSIGAMANKYGLEKRE